MGENSQSENVASGPSAGKQGNQVVKPKTIIPSAKHPRNIPANAGPSEQEGEQQGQNVRRGRGKFWSRDRAKNEAPAKDTKEQSKTGKEVKTGKSI
jgi:hypothetical protein